MKKRGFGAGKWNGAGGKLEDGETVEKAAVRETQEEIGVLAKTLEDRGNIKFYFPENPDWDQHMHIYFVHSWQGEPIESEEMLPKWFDLNDLPYDEMWSSDTHWIPEVMSGKKIEADFYFKGKGEEVEKFEIREI